MKCPKKHVKYIFHVLAYPFLGALKNEHKKVGHFKNKHVINFKTEKEPKMKFFHFGIFKKCISYAAYAIT